MAQRRQSRVAPTSRTASSSHEPAWRRFEAEIKSKPRRRAKNKRSTYQSALAQVSAAQLDLTPRVWTRVARRISRRQWITLSLSTACLVGLAALLFYGPFTVWAADVQVSGNERVQTEGILAASSVDGLNIFTLQPSAVAEHLLSMQGIAAATVHVRLPNQVSIQISEYVPLVTWRYLDKVRLLDSSGAEIPVGGDSPALTLFDEAGAAVGSDDNLRSGVLDDLRLLHAARPEVTDAYYGTLEGLYFRAAGGWTIYLGNEGDMETKLRLLSATEEELTTEGKHINVIDMRADGPALMW